MKLYLGGMAQGKLELAQKENEEVKLENLKESNHICDCSICTKEEIFYRKFIYGFHIYIKRFIQTQEQGEACIKELLMKNPECIIISDDVGCGVVPIQKQEREYRELVGRIVCQLADYAEIVKRVMAGIAVQIK